MRFEDCSWFDVESYLAHDDRLIIVIGACEQHGYLSLLTDVKIPLALADAASRISGVLVAPPLNFGCSPYFLAYPGTLSLRISTMLDAVEDIIRSAHDTGFRRILFLNGHGGNDAVRSRLYELANQLPALRFAWYAWWQSPSVEQVIRKHNLKGSHASWMEAFPFTRVGDLPKGEKTPPHVPGLLNADQARFIYGDGMFGGKYQEDKTVLDEIFQAALEDVLSLLDFANM